VRALETARGVAARGLLVTPHRACEETAAQRLERVRLIERSVLVAEVERLLEVIREYRRGWNDDAGVRADGRTAVADQVPPLDWLWRATELVPSGSRPRRSSAHYRGSGSDLAERRRRRRRVDLRSRGWTGMEL
jgi:hypothetical protein